MNRNALMIAVLAVAVFTFGVSYRNTVPFGPGPDPFDYITTARHLVKDGTLRFPIQAPARLGVDAKYNPLFIPEPFVPAADGKHYVSLYSPGTSFLMALLILICGPNLGPYLLGPLMAAACVPLVYLVASRFFRQREALAAALLCVLSPVFLAPARAPLSDVPALFFVLLSLVLLLRWTTPRTAAAAGVAWGAVGLTRPVLLVLLPVVVLGIWWVEAGSGRRRRLQAFLFGLAPGLIALAGFNTYLYGSPLTTGYALLPGFFRPFGLEYFPRSFPRRMQGLVMMAGPVAVLAALVAILRRRNRWTTLATWWVAVVVGFYSFYRISNSIRLHRFLLVLLPVIVLLSLAGFGLARTRERRATGATLGLVVLLVGAIGNLAILGPRYALLQPYHIDPYVPQVNLEVVAQIVGPEGVVFSRVWGGRLQEEQGLITANWSRTSAVPVRALVNDLLDRGRSVYLIDYGDFSRRGMVYVGLNVEPVHRSAAGPVLYSVGRPREGVPVPIRVFVPTPRD